MEYLECGDLGPWVKNPVVQSQAREITTQLLSGLAIMHEKFICHRDIKPQVWGPLGFANCLNADLTMIKPPPEYPCRFIHANMGEDCRFWGI